MFALACEQAQWRNFRSTSGNSSLIWPGFGFAVRGLYNAFNFLQNSHNRHLRARYGMFVVILIFDSLSGTVLAVSCEIWWYKLDRTVTALDCIFIKNLNYSISMPDGMSSACVIFEWLYRWNQYSRVLKRFNLTRHLQWLRWDIYPASISRLTPYAFSCYLLYCISRSF